MRKSVNTAPTPGSAADIFGPLRMPTDVQADTPTRFERAAERARTAWENRPDIFELHFIYLPVYLPVAVAAGAIAVGTLDQVFHTHIARGMANVHVDKKDNVIERNIEKAVHDLGVQAVKAEK